MSIHSATNSSSTVKILPIGILTCTGLEEYKKADHALIALWNAQKVPAEQVIWNQPTKDWKQYRAIIVLSTWDYFRGNLKKFLKVLQEIHSAGVPLFNSLETIEWNCTKNYLKELREKGISIIETIWLSKSDLPNIAKLAKEKKWKEYILKPTVSAGGFSTHRIKEGDAFDAIIDKCKDIDSDWMLQPFMEEIIKQGEWSFIFIGGEYSHAVLKKPTAGNFLVQPFNGGWIDNKLPEPWMIAQAHDIVKATKQDTLCARIDAIYQGTKCLVMEIEMIEPDLYSQYNKECIGKLFSTIEKKLTQLETSKALEIARFSHTVYKQCTFDFIMKQLAPVTQFTTETFLKNHLATKLAYERSDAEYKNDFVRLFEEHVADLLQEIERQKGLFFVALDGEKIIAISAGRAYGKPSVSHRYIEKVQASKSTFKDVLNDWWALMEKYQLPQKESLPFSLYHQSLIAVHPQYMRKGIGKRLVEHTQREIHKLGYAALAIETSTLAAHKMVDTLHGHDYSVVDIDKKEKAETGTSLRLRIVLPKGASLEKEIVHWFQSKKSS